MSKRPLAVNAHLWRIYFSRDTVQNAKGKTSWPTIRLSLDQGHCELRLPTAMVSWRKVWWSKGLGNSEARGNRFLLGGIQDRQCCRHTDSSLPPSLCPLLLSFCLLPCSYLSWRLVLTGPTCQSLIQRSYFIVTVFFIPTAWALRLWSDPALIKLN